MCSTIPEKELLTFTISLIQVRHAQAQFPKVLDFEITDLSGPKLSTVHASVISERFGLINNSPGLQKEYGAHKSNSRKFWTYINYKLRPKTSTVC